VSYPTEVKSLSIIPHSSLFIPTPFVRLIITPQFIPLHQIIHIGIGILILRIIVPVEIFIVAIFVRLIFEFRAGR
jgi:hypothetical protein